MRDLLAQGIYGIRYRELSVDQQQVINDEVRHFTHTYEDYMDYED